METVLVSTMSNRAFSLVCAVDLSERSSAVIEHALSEAHRHREMSMHFLTVCEAQKGRFLKTDPTLADMQEADARLRALVRESMPTFSDPSKSSRSEVRFHTRGGKADEQILELALEARADRVIIGHHSSDSHRRPMGGIAAAVVKAAICTVEVVQTADYGEVEEDYAACAECVLVREQSGGERWFCEEHSDGRAPRLSGNLGITSPALGWGNFSY